MLWLTPRRTFLTALSLLALIEGCAGQFKPTPWLIDVKNGICEPYVITDSNPLTYAPSGKPEPLVNCDGFTAFSPADTAEALREFRECQQQGQCD